MAKNHLGEDPISVHVHGLRNQTAEFEGGPADLLVGGIAGPSYAGKEHAVLLTIEGKDEKTGKVVDIEIAVSVSQIDALIARLQHRAGIKGH